MMMMLFKNYIFVKLCGYKMFEKIEENKEFYRRLIIIKLK